MTAAPTRSGRAWSSRRRGPGRRPSAVERPVGQVEARGGLVRPRAERVSGRARGAPTAGALRGIRRQVRGDRRPRTRSKPRAAPRAAPYFVKAGGGGRAAARVGAVAVPCGPVHAGRARRERGARRGTGPRRRRRAPGVRCARTGLVDQRRLALAFLRSSTARGGAPPRPRWRPAPPRAHGWDRRRAPGGAVAKDGRARTRGRWATWSR